MKLSLIENNHQVACDITLEQIVDKIQGDKMIKRQITTYRSGDDKVKRRLPAIAPCGTFRERRREENLNSYSGIIQIDIDHIDQLTIRELKCRLSNYQFIILAYVSPGAEGLKILIKTDAVKENHLMAFNQVCDWVEKELGVEPDRKVKSIAQQCYLSHDPDVYYNPHYKQFKITNMENVKKFEKAIQMIEDMEFVEGERNTYIYKLSCLCNKFGIPNEETEEYMIEEGYTFDDIDNGELRRTILSAYEGNEEEFGMWDNAEKGSSLLINDDVYNALPRDLRNLTELFEGTERDVFLVSSLGILSGCFPMVTGQYASDIIGPNLYTYIIAKAASGKGVVYFGKRIAQKINEEIYKLSEERYVNDMGGPQDPPKPHYLFIAGNTSSASLIEDINNNEGHAIILETEADTIGGNKKNEWGNISPFMRVAFHGEDITFSRRTGEKLCIKNPKLSIIITSTPGQISGILSNVEDGLFSRYLFYSFKTMVEWKSPRPASYDDYYRKQEIIDTLGEKVLQFYTTYMNNSIRYYLSQKQWDTLDKVFDKLLKVAVKSNSDMIASVKRMGLIVFRISMILSIIRNIEENEIEEISCTDEDFNNAVRLGKLLLKHAYNVAEYLPEGEDSKLESTYRMNLIYSKLKDENFDRKDYVKIAKEIGVPAPTAYRYFKKDPRIIRGELNYKKAK